MRAPDLTVLDPEQAEAAHAPRGPVCVLAGAGTGKTRTITYRIAHLVATGQVRSDQVLAVTFTARAAAELRTRLRALGLGSEANLVQARTFHAAALRQLRYFWPQVVGDVPWRIVDSKFPLVARAAARIGFAGDKDTIRDLISEIEWAKSCLLAPEDYPTAVRRLHRTPPADPMTVARIYTGYESDKSTPEGLLLDFDDLLLHTAAALEDYPAVADEFRGRYRSFVVDEYQDVTPLQQRVLDAWLGERDDLTVVGDANQTIYSFTGATPDYLLDFSRRFPDATMIRLERDYRSTPQVVSLANRMIAMSRGRIAGTRLQLIGQRRSGPEPVFTEYDDSGAEAVAVARAVAALLADGVSAAQIAVLYRINAQSVAIEQALTERGIAYQVRGGEGFFHREEVRAAVRALQRTASRDDLPEPARTGAALTTLVRAVLAPLGLTTTPPTGAEASQRWSSLDALVALTAELVADEPQLELAGLLRELSARAAARHPPTVAGVTLASLHAAKGLEWDAVFLIGLTDGTLPISRVLNRDGSPADQQALEEERRLGYVGVTRARERLYLSWSRARLVDGRRVPSRRSRFLTGLVPTPPDSTVVSEDVPPTAAVGDRPYCWVCAKPLIGTYATLLGRCRRCPAELDTELLGALRQWRTEQAQLAGVSEISVCTDTTLTAIAEQLPRDSNALAGIAGIGPHKLPQYGADILALVHARTRLRVEP